MSTIADIAARIESLSEEARADVERILRMEVCEGLNAVPEAMRAKASRWCGGGEDPTSEAWKSLEKQTTVSVHNRWTYETSNFNMLRACRPVAGPSGIAEERAPDAVASACAGPGRCDFCEVEALTCVEPFGRLRGKHCITSGNAFKSAGLHSLVIWSRHEPHQLTVDEVVDGLETADAWFERAAAWDAARPGGAAGGARYPAMFWNTFRGSGASQIHPHMQLQLFRSRVARDALMLDQGERYEQQYPSRCLCEDILLAHQRLGLTASARAWASLTPRVLGGELCALGPPAAAVEGSGTARLAPLGAMVAAMHAALRRCGAESISTAAFRVPAGGAEEVWMVHCSNRGAACPQIVDAGSAELLGLAGVGSDPFKLAEALREELKA